MILTFMNDTNIYESMSDTDKKEVAYLLIELDKVASSASPELLVWCRHCLQMKKSTFVLAWGSLTFECHPDGRVMNYFVAMAVKIAKGSSFPLAQFFIGNLYHCLDLLVNDEMEGCNSKVVYSTLNVYFLQMFLWERFPRYADKGVSLSALRSRFDGCSEKFLNYGPSEFPTVCNWFGKNFTGKKAFRGVMDMEEEFCWGPYNKVRSGNVKFVRVLALPSLAEGKCEEKEIPAAAMDNFTTCFVANGLRYWSFVKHCFCTILYQPQRVRRQFGLDQRIPFSIATEMPWDRCILRFTKKTAIKIFSEGRLCIVGKSLLPSMTSSMVRYWSTCMRYLNEGPTASLVSAGALFFSGRFQELNKYPYAFAFTESSFIFRTRPMPIDESKKRDEAHELATDVAPKGALRRTNRIKRDKEINNTEIMDMTESVPENTQESKEFVENEDSSQAINVPIRRDLSKKLFLTKTKTKVDIDQFVNAGETSIPEEQVNVKPLFNAGKTPSAEEQVTAGHPLDADKTPSVEEQVSARHPLDAGETPFAKEQVAAMLVNP
ncbi:hypothetical protein CCACVL1_31025 [Corchorus capsularis]|uniref:Aminotransferase-like plant mobile domain-containing protein n=1 Tax=Corchorus capsularis TaxID=210143 RepID=A0A1R3FUG0_COCAP|nr:hypothetical protein CCACVL1_31025 [Corchorus capsularis]